MADVQRPEEPPHYRLVESQRVGKDKKEEEKVSDREKRPLILTALILDLFEKFTSFLFKGKQKKQIVDKKQVVQDLKVLKTLFKELARKDTSHQPEFVEMFAHTWVLFISDWRCFKSFEQQYPYEYAKMQQLIQAIRTYPPASDHTLGYYLRKHVGDKWFPFPFMEILEKLHIEYQHDKQTSHLDAWISSIEELTEEKDEGREGKDEG